jgi:uncharacterized protein YqeY
MDLRAKLQEAIKAKNDLAKDVLRVLMGEASTREARTGQPPSEADVHAIVRKLIASNTETRTELERRGQTGHSNYQRLAEENTYLEGLLPKSPDTAAIRRELEAIAGDLKAAKNDGQATGLAMKHLKQKGLAVQGEQVAAAVKEIRGG